MFNKKDLIVSELKNILKFMQFVSKFLVLTNITIRNNCLYIILAKHLKHH